MDLPLGLLLLLSLIFLHHNKDGGYNSTNINKQLSSAQNTPALQTSAKKTQSFGLVCSHSRPRSHLAQFVTKTKWPIETTGSGEENGLFEAGLSSWVN